MAEDWKPDAVDIRAAYAEGLDLGKVEDQVELFRNFYLAECGPRVHRTDWRKAWRTWVRKNVHNNPRIYRGTEPANAAMMAKLVGQMVERRR